MGLVTDKQQADALYYLAMGIEGHGVSLSDDYEDELEHAGEVLGKTFDPAPFDDEMNELDDLAFEAVQTYLAGETDVTPKKIGIPRESHVKFEAEMGTGDVVRGEGQVRGCIFVGRIYGGKAAHRLVIKVFDDQENRAGEFITALPEECAVIHASCVGA
jgi:hypothetical protein